MGRAAQGPSNKTIRDEARQQSKKNIVFEHFRDEAYFAFRAVMKPVQATQGVAADSKRRDPQVSDIHQSILHFEEIL